MRLSPTHPSRTGAGWGEGGGWVWSRKRYIVAQDANRNRTLGVSGTTKQNGHRLFYSLAVERAAEARNKIHDETLARCIRGNKWTTK